MGLKTCWQPNVEAVRLAVVPNTLELAELWVSPALAKEAKGNPHLEVTGEALSLPFDAAGNLEQERLFPHSVRGRRRAHQHRLRPREVASYTIGATSRRWPTAEVHHVGRTPASNARQSPG